MPHNARDARDAGLILGSGRSPEGGNGNSLQYSCLKNSMDKGVWQATASGIAESRIRLSKHTHTHTQILMALSEIIYLNIHIFASY